MFKEDKIILSFSIESISGKEKFKDNRRGLIEFLNNNFNIIAEKKMFGENFLILSKSL
jgi:hypothetical protein